MINHAAAKILFSRGKEVVHSNLLPPKWKKGRNVGGFFCSGCSCGDHNFPVDVRIGPFIAVDACVVQHINVVLGAVVRLNNTLAQSSVVKGTGCPAKGRCIVP